MFTFIHLHVRVYICMRNTRILSVGQVSSLAKAGMCGQVD
jgi:hypothetical protein